MSGRVLSQVWIWILALGLFVQFAGLLFNNDGSRYATQIYLVLFVPALILLLWRRLSLETWRQAPGFILLSLLAWVVLSSLFNSGAAKDPAYWVKIVLLILLYVFVVASLVSHQDNFNKLLVVIVAVGAFFAWWTLYYQFGVLDKPLDYKEIRYTGRLSELGWNGLADLKHPVVAGLYYGVFAVLLSYLFVGLKVRIWQVALLALGMLGLLAYVLLTFSRGAWFSTAAGGFILLLLFPNSRSRSLIGLGGFLILLAIYLFWAEVQNEFRQGVSNRDLIWQSWIERFPEFWIAGTGAGADFNFTFPPPHQFSVIHAHSLYLQLWYEYGIVGITLFVLLLLSLVWKGWECRAQPLARLGVALLVYAMVAMISDVYAIFHRPSPYWVIFWFPVGILLGVKPPEHRTSHSVAANELQTRR
ncbi:MAG: O-antigen ligase family protein [Gammaproteobacteria bacterium]|nr:O-antigen ligase family protein [Gammaproteobacteria bacterium]MBU2064329.1 O-antigen ligase family protein [Gammaproteobacteria bacterium]MBU2179395.1 O-antigen ligase family protein [Gammaproteobacteria bacterium]MBU2255549.1 O-antigen ligase family protein [Gammaproteobacteria bacterium]MBU2293823.1 O-antigen ligase family protein [Gammaproteobacteria bacterium]